MYVLFEMNGINSRVSFYGHLLATLSFMPHARQSSGDCQKKRLHSEIFENSEQYNTLCVTCHVTREL